MQKIARGRWRSGVCWEVAFVVVMISLCGCLACADDWAQVAGHHSHVEHGPGGGARNGHRLESTRGLRVGRGQGAL